MAKLVEVENKEEILKLKKRKKLLDNSKSLFQIIQFCLICFLVYKALT